MNEFNQFLKPKSLKKPKCVAFLKVNNFFLPFRSIYKERLILAFRVKFFNSAVEIIKPYFPSSVVIESDTAQFVRSGYKVFLLPLKNCFILGDKRLATLKAPIENVNLF